ncbi:hypothetical protein MIND_00668000 [Mycena indigotica]|uniref:Uncharacterized protein n=1 Tax=Mycena indigotica TaxID=2126181 RepID=A0A8H6SLJ1_9AGAR|nr:uncharacterized protein MIND_00668000 [Mycena indigotica]KAF7301042.1 hypothetical protein MIND_00668000 [Mycena indigotica]
MVSAFPGWTTWNTLAATPYYTRFSPVLSQNEGEEGSAAVRLEPPNRPLLVVDDVRLCTLAEKGVQSTYSSDEIHVLQSGISLLVFHSSQTAFYWNRPRESARKKRTLYWRYIATHNAHPARIFSEKLPQTWKLASVYLKWCSLGAKFSLRPVIADKLRQGALTSLNSKVKIPYSLRHSQELTSLLDSLGEPRPSSQMHSDWERLAEDTRDPIAESSLRLWNQQSPGIERSAEETGEDIILAENADEETRKLQISIIASVLVEKYTHQAAEETISEAYSSPARSKVMNGLFWTLNYLTLGAFLRYHHRLAEVRSAIITDEQWRSHILQLVKEWEEFNLISTVLLSASAGILALPSVQGVPRTAILISILGSFASVTSGLYCISMYQVRTKDERSNERTNDMDKFNYSEYTSDNKTVSLVLGLPMAFLVWALVAFTVGILSYNVVATKTAGRVSDVAYAVIAVAIVMLILLVLALYSLSSLWGVIDGHSRARRFFRFVLGRRAGKGGAGKLDESSREGLEIVRAVSPKVRVPV